MTTSARLVAACEQPVPGGWLRVIRVGFGLVAALSAGRLLAHGWVDQLWLDPAVRLPYAGLEWLPVLPAGVLHAVVAATGVLGLLVAVGRQPRVAAALWVLGFGYLELLEQSTYLNHYWAMTLVGTLLALAPQGDTVARGWLWLMRVQVGVIYLFAGIAKLDADWLLRGEPLATWLVARADLPLVGPLLVVPATALLLSWAAAVFDLTIVGWLWWRPTRPLALAAMVSFHAATWLLFPMIGVFPLLMVILASAWLPPEWPTRLTARARRTGALPDRATIAEPARRVVRGRVLVALLVVWTAAQVVLPLRHLAIPGDVRWNEAGGRLAWRVMAEEKVGWAVFHITDAAGATARVAITQVLTPAQAHAAAVRPEMLVMTARALADRHKVDGVPAEVRADAVVTWNGRPAQPLLDPTVDLAGALPHGWVLPPDPPTVVAGR